VTVSDKKLAVSVGGTTIDYYTADVVTASDYYPFGSQMPGRKFAQANSSYRYGFNGQENSDEIAAGLTTAMYWEYDSRIGRRWNVDPIVKVEESPYLCFSGSPILFSDPLGDDVKKGGDDKPIVTKGTNLPEIVLRSTIRKKPTIDLNTLVKINTKSTCHISNDEVSTALNKSFSSALAAANNGKGLDTKNGQVALPANLFGKIVNFIFGSDVYYGFHPTTGELGFNGFAIKNDGYVDTHQRPVALTAPSAGIKGGVGIWSSSKRISSVKNAFGHWKKHGGEFPQFTNAKQYVEGARNFLNNSPAGTLIKIRTNGDILKYHQATNTFGVMNSKGLPKTMFKPLDAIKYWLAQ
jgi:RHS repeat-associated protein